MSQSVSAATLSSPALSRPSSLSPTTSMRAGRPGRSAVDCTIARRVGALDCGADGRGFGRDRLCAAIPVTELSNASTSPAQVSIANAVGAGHR